MPSDAEHLRSFLADRDITCPVCAYNLRGVEGEACPECGARLDLRVGSLDLRLGPWLTAVLAVAVPMGFNGVMSLVGLVALTRVRYWSSTDGLLLLTSLTFVLVCSGLLVFVAKRRARFLRRPRREQWVHAGMMVAVMTAAQAGQLLYFFSRI